MNTKPLTQFDACLRAFLIIACAVLTVVSDDPWFKATSPQWIIHGMAWLTVAFLTWRGLLDQSFSRVPPSDATVTTSSTQETHVDSPADPAKGDGGV